MESFIKILTKIISIFSVLNKQDEIGFLDASAHLVLKVYFNCIFFYRIRKEKPCGKDRIVMRGKQIQG